MCLLIHAPDAATLAADEALLSNAFARNGDGWGVMYADAGRIRTHKGFKYDTLADRIGRLAGREVFVHLRLATHGDVSLRNNHPFLMCGGRYALMHNGIVPIQRWDQRYSDTWHFARKVERELADHPERFGSRKAAKRWTRQIDWSRIAILRADGESMFLNHDDGVEYRGMWLSNDHSTPRNRQYTYALPDRDDGLWREEGKDFVEAFWDDDLRCYVKWDDAEQDWVLADQADLTPDQRLDDYLRSDEARGEFRFDEFDDYAIYG